jgi:hypothetical protein
LRSYSETGWLSKPNELHDCSPSQPTYWQNFEEIYYLKEQETIAHNIIQTLKMKVAIYKGGKHPIVRYF